MPLLSKRSTPPINNLIYIILFLPIIYTGLYIAHNNQLPGNDAANYFSTAVTIYQSFQDHGFWHGLIHYYVDRGWRPIFFPNLSVPFLLVSQGNLFFAYGSVAFLSLFASLSYVYLFMRLKVDRLSAVISTSLICLLPFIQAQLVMFYAEGFLFPCIMGSLYHLIKSDYLRKINHTYGFIILTTLALIVRPIEAVTHLLLILIAYLSCGYLKQVFTAKQLVNIIFICLFSAFLFFSVAAIPYRHGHIISIIDNSGPLDIKMAHTIHSCFIGLASVALISGILLVMMHFSKIAAKKPQIKNYLSLTFASIAAMVLFWFLPFAFETFQWIYRTSLGDVAMNTGSLSGSQFSWNVLHIYLREEGLLAVIVISIIAIFGGASLTSKKLREVIFSQPVLYLLLLAPFPIWEAFFTVQIVTRKLSIVFPAILMAMLILGLQKNNGWRFRISIISLLLLVQFGLLTTLLYTKDYHNKDPLLNNSIGYFIPQPSTITPNPHNVVMHFFNEQAKTHSLRSFGLEVIPGTPDARHPVEAEPINPFLLSMMISASRKTYYANYLYFGVYTEENLKKINQQYDAIFLSDRLTEMKISPNAASYYSQKYAEETNASLKTFYELMSYYSQNKLVTIGLKQGPCIVINTQKQGPYRGCLLFPIKNQRVTKS